MKPKYTKPTMKLETVEIECSISNSSNIYINVQQSEIQSEWQKEVISIDLEW